MTKLEARTGEHSVPKLIHSIVYCLLRHLCCILLLYNSCGQGQRDAMAIIHQYTRNVDPQYILTTQCSHTHKSNCNLLHVLNVVWNIKASPFNLKKKISRPRRLFCNIHKNLYFIFLSGFNEWPATDSCHFFFLEPFNFACEKLLHFNALARNGTNLPRIPCSYI